MNLLWMIPLVVCATGTPLDDYIRRYDPEYKYNIIGKYQGPGYTNYVVNMTSQRWKSDRVLDRPVWWHYLTITIPDKLTYKDAGFLFIDGDSNTDSPPTGSDIFVTLTTLLGIGIEAVTANLKMVPNQPIVYKRDPSQKKRDEDDNIAWSWREFLVYNSSDPDVLLQLPMTKSAVRAMDTVTKVIQQILGNGIKRYFVSGASKRGWATWLTAAVDKRVFAMAPIVENLLNLRKSLHHHFRSLGGWTWAFNPYYETDITPRLDDPEFVKFERVIDPLAYKDRYKNIPKLVITSTGDEFFLLDDSHFYFQYLKDNTSLRILPNAEHTCIGHIVTLMFSLKAFFLSTVTKSPIPKLNWTRTVTTDGGKIVLQTDTLPTSITAFHARTLDDKRRDFRLFAAASANSSEKAFHPVFWYEKNVTKLSNYMYEVAFDNPPYGWLAFLIQVTFNGVRSSVLEFTTETQIIPDTYPYPECHGRGCFGILV